MNLQTELNANQSEIRYRPDLSDLIVYFFGLIALTITSLHNLIQILSTSTSTSNSISNSVITFASILQNQINKFGFNENIIINTVLLRLIAIVWLLLPICFWFQIIHISLANNRINQTINKSLNSIILPKIELSKPIIESFGWKSGLNKQTGITFDCISPVNRVSY